MTAYLLGGCMACGQMLKASAPKKDCCHADKCSRSQHSGHKHSQPAPEQACGGPALQSVVPPPSQVSAVALQSASHPAEFVGAFAAEAHQDHHLTASRPHAPPLDRPILHAALLI
jgi:hypothetical protein